MNTAAATARRAGLIDELAKVPAFVRRDMLVMISYRAAFVGDLLSLLTQVLLFYFVGEMVEPSSLPTYEGTTATYLEFVAIGIAVGVFVQVGLARIAAVMRAEQLMGTLESLLVTPTRATTLQLGSVAFDLVYVPLRTTVFLVVMVVAFGIDLHLDGLPASLLMLLVFIPFVWGLGLLGAAGILTFRRGGGVAGLAGTLLILASGAYFPVELLPGWLATLADANPIAVTIDGMRSALIGGGGWPSLGRDLLLIGTASCVSLVVGMTGFRWALRRERDRGTIGLY
jgi:ABC-2 type transport system permease protein